MNTASAFALSYTVYPEHLALFDGSLPGFLRWRYPSAVDDELSTWIAAGRVCVNGAQAEADQPLYAGQQVAVEKPEHQESETRLDWQPVWENDELLAVYKPPGLPVSRTTRNLYHTLISLIRRETPYYDAHLLHRLDTETDGLILLAKDKAADLKWKPRLSELIVGKYYLARVTGAPEWQTQTVEVSLSEQVGSAIRSRMYVVDPKTPALFPKPKASRTGFEVIARQPQEALILCELFSGRKHQIRVHLAHLGYPIIGDKIYAHDGTYYLKRLEGPLDAGDWSELGAEHHQLTATRLQLQPDPQLPPITIELPLALSAAWQGFYKT